MGRAVGHDRAVVDQLFGPLVRRSCHCSLPPVDRHERCLVPRALLVGLERLLSALGRLECLSGEVHIAAPYLPTGNISGATRYYAVNSLSALDAPREYYLNRTSGSLYLQTHTHTHTHTHMQPKKQKKQKNKEQQREPGMDRNEAHEATTATMARMTTMKTTATQNLHNVCLMLFPLST